MLTSGLVNNIYACAGSNINLQANIVTMPMKFELKLVISLTPKPLSIIQIIKAFTLYCPEQGILYCGCVLKKSSAVTACSKMKGSYVQCIPNLETTIPRV